MSDQQQESVVSEPECPHGEQEANKIVLCSQEEREEFFLECRIALGLI